MCVCVSVCVCVCVYVCVCVCVCARLLGSLDSILVLSLCDLTSLLWACVPQVVMMEAAT